MTQDVLLIKEKLKSLISEIQVGIRENVNDDFVFEYEDDKGEDTCAVVLDAGVYTYDELATEIASKCTAELGETVTADYLSGDGTFAFSLPSDHVFIEMGGGDYPLEFDWTTATPVGGNLIAVDVIPLYLSLVGDYPQDVKIVANKKASALVIVPNYSADLERRTGRQLNAECSPVIKLYANNVDYDDIDYYVSWIITKIFDDLHLGGLCKSVSEYSVSKGDFGSEFDNHSPNHNGAKTLTDITLKIYYNTTR